MKKTSLLTLLMALAMPFSAFAVESPIVDEVPSSVDANTYVLTIFVEPGAKVTVVGGSSQIAPVTDGLGADVEDGEVEIMVGLGQNTVNTFSITAEKDGEVSDSVVIEITEQTSVSSNASGDTNPPQVPSLNEIPAFVDAKEYIISGETEPLANIYAYTVQGIVAGTTQADDNGYFQVTVDLEEDKTNRFNVTAEDEAGNESSASQAVIRQVVQRDSEEKEEPLVTSAQVFFGDIDGHWAESYINQLYSEGVVSGRSENVFDPNGLITRAELTKIAILATGHSTITTVHEHPFQDVPLNSWFAPYVNEAVRLGIASGYPSGGYGPNDFITRAAALKIILAAAGFEVSDTSNDFTDVNSNDWFAPYVSFASKNGIVNGYLDGSFGPGRNITRAEVAKIMIKVLELRDEEVACATNEYEGEWNGEMFAFDYPCDWELATYQGEQEEQAYVKHPDGQALFYYPAPSLEALDGELLEELEMEVDGDSYEAKTYLFGDANITLIDLGGGDFNAHMSLYYENEDQFDTLKAILSTFDFK